MAPLVDLKVRALFEDLITALVEASEQGLHSLCFFIESLDSLKDNRTFFDAIDSLVAVRIVLLPIWNQALCGHL